MKRRYYLLLCPPPLPVFCAHIFFLFLPVAAFLSCFFYEFATREWQNSIFLCVYLARFLDLLLLYIFFHGGGRSDSETNMGRIERGGDTGGRKKTEISC